ncbi:MAG TPA: SBBP repeat-containing protein, partial [Candidatus Binatia bacterium]
MPLSFVENRGQVDRRVSYYLRGKDKSLYFGPGGITFVLNVEKREQPPALARLVPSSAAPRAEREKDRWALRLDFIDAAGVAPVGEEPTPAVFSYFKGPREEWKTGLKNYSKLVYADLWPGIDLVYSGTSDRLKYMFVVKPGADPRRIRLAYRGASALGVNARQELEIATPAGTFHDDRPFAYQEIAGRRVEVPMAYALAADAAATGRYGFRVGAYDAAKPLVLDPAIVIYSGFIGGLGDDRANGVAVDSAGNAYITGETSSDQTTFPDGNGFGPIPGGDKIQNGGVDAFVAKIKPDGSGLVYATFIGGSGT